MNPKSQFCSFRKGFNSCFHVITIVSNLLDYSVKAEILNFKERGVCDLMLYVHIKDGYKSFLSANLVLVVDFPYSKRGKLSLPVANIRNARSVSDSSAVFTSLII